MKVMSLQPSVMDAPIDEITSEGMASDTEMDHSGLSPLTPSFEGFDRWQANIGLKAFAEGLTAAAKAVFPSQSGQKYSKVQVLMLEWERQELHVLQEVDTSELFHVLKDTFNFDVDRWQIPSKGSQVAAIEKLDAFLEPGSNNYETLKILYYSGHSRHGRSDQLMFTKYATFVFFSLPC